MKEMHQRIMTRARKDVTIAMDEQMMSGDTTELTNKLIKLKAQVTALEWSERDGTHLNNIKDVTENGIRLLDMQPITTGDKKKVTTRMSSPEVLKRVIAYNAIDIKKAEEEF